MKVAPSAVTTSTHLSSFAAPSHLRISDCRPKQPRLLQQVCASSRGTTEATMQEVRSGRQLYIQQRDGNPEGYLAGQQVLFAHGANGDHSLVCMVMTCMVMGKQPCMSPPCSPCCAAVTAALLMCKVKALQCQTLRLISNSVHMAVFSLATAICLTGTYACAVQGAGGPSHPSWSLMHKLRHARSWKEQQAQACHSRGSAGCLQPRRALPGSQGASGHAFQGKGELRRRCRQRHSCCEMFFRHLCQPEPEKCPAATARSFLQGPKSRSAANSACSSSCRTQPPAP